MRGLNWVLRGFLFLLLLVFALKNSTPVTVRFFFGVSWETPLAFVMLLFFALGTVLGLSAALGTVLRRRRRAARLARRKAAEAARSAAEPMETV